MSERTGVVTMKGGGMTLLGSEIKAGDKAPDFEVINNDLEKKTLSDFAGSVLVIASVPSLDTPVCATETRKFNEKASQMGDDVKVLTVSMDLPFAQARWCGAEGIDNVVTLSDFNSASFGENYGVLLKELRLLARAVFVVDKQGVVRYVQIVPEITDEPDYAEVISAVEKL